MGLKKIVNTISFRTKLLSGIVAIIVVNTIFTGFIYYNHAYQDTMNNYYRTSADLTEQISTYLEEHISGITSTVNALHNNLSFISSVRDCIGKETSLSYGKELGSIADFLSQFELSDSLIDSVYLYTEKAEFDNFVKIKNPYFNFNDSLFFEYFSQNPQANFGFFYSTNDYLYQSEYSVIPIVYRKWIDDTSLYYLVALDVGQIENYLYDHFSAFNNVCIVNGDRVVVNTSEGDVEELIKACELKQDGAYHLNLDEADYIVTCKEMSMTGWRIYGVKVAGELTENLQSIQFLIIAQLIVVTSLVLILGILFSTNLSVPLIQLANIMSKAGENQFHTKFEYNSQDEIGQLANSFNNMEDEINQLVEKLNHKINELEMEKEKVKWEQDEKRKAEFKALQAQINPHFLYNTLNTISWQAADLGAMEICVLTNLLGKFFRSSLNRGREYITIKEEIEQVKSYLEIQKIRYASRMDFIINIPTEILQSFTINLILQPLVENAIYHGIKESKRKGTIQIYGERVSQENTEIIMLYVEDDGQGIEIKRLELLNQKLSQGIVDSDSGYGIYNVNQRIRLSYGADYGVVLQSQYKQGTKAIITLPYQQTAKSEPYSID